MSDPQERPRILSFIEEVRQLLRRPSGRVVREVVIFGQDDAQVIDLDKEKAGKEAEENR